MEEAGGATIQAGNLAFMEPDEITTGGEIIDISPENAIVPLVFDSSAQAKAKLLANIAALREQYKEVPEDLSVKANYKLVAGAHGVFKKTISRIEATRKERKANILEQGRFIDSSAKMVKEMIEEIKTPFTEAKDAYDTKLEIEKREKALAEEKRIDGIAERIAGIKALVEANISSSAAVIMQNIIKLDSENPIKEWAMEFTEKAEETIQAVTFKLHELYNMKLQQEQAAQLAAEAEAKRIADEEAARIAREKQAEEVRKKLDEEQAKLKEERDRLAADQKKLADERAKLAAEQLAEQTRLHNDRVAREEAERVEADRKAKEEEAERGRLEGIRLEGERIQREKDAETERVAQRLRDDIEALKNPKPAEQEVKQLFSDEKIREIENACAEIDTAKVLGDAIASFNMSPADQRRTAGKAMLAFIGNFTATKNLLDAIIRGEIPYIVYTGEKS